MTQIDTKVPRYSVIGKPQRALLVTCESTASCGPARLLLDGPHSRHDRFVIDVASGHFGEQTDDKCEMDRDFASLLVVRNRVGLHAYEVSKALDAEARLVQLTKEIFVGHRPIFS